MLGETKTKTAKAKGLWNQLINRQPEIFLKTLEPFAANVLRLNAVFYLGLSEQCLSAKNITTNKQIITESMLQYFVAGTQSEVIR